MSRLTEEERDISIAIVGMSGRFPRAAGLREFWENLRDGTECTTFFDDETLAAAGIDAFSLSHPSYVKAKPMLEEIDHFDAEFFGISPRDAEVMDPQFRIFLEASWSALESAGYVPESCEGRVAVFAGASRSQYLTSNLLSNRNAYQLDVGMQTLIGTTPDFLATQVSYRLNLTGPSMTVQTACSTSLVAVCQAAQSLLSYQCDMALAGGVSLSLPITAGYVYKEGGIVSPDGHCRPFDAKADGTILGEGVGVVVLKRLRDALDDGDHVHAVIRGFAVNNDGGSRLFFTAPGVEGQVDAIEAAQAMAGVGPETIGYVEAHGSGTPLGDQIEVAALQRVFARTGRAGGGCAIGSVKGNLGHLVCAAGVAGLIKTVLALEHRQIPPSLNCEVVNPEFDLEDAGLFVNSILRDWEPRGGAPRRAGVTSSGMGGTNAHVVLEEAPPTHERPVCPREEVLFISARNESSLEKATDQLAAWLKEDPGCDLAAAAQTLRRGRRAFRQRRALVCRDASEAADLLERRDPERLLGGVAPDRQRPVVFMFSGVGDHYVGVAHGLHESEPVFRREFDRCLRLFEPLLGIDLGSILYPEATRSGDRPAASVEAGLDFRAMLEAGRRQRAASSEEIHRTLVSQPVVFAVEYALARMWLERGVIPEAMIGHSLGEYVAACVAGVISLDDAARIVARRAKLIDALPPGGMLAVMQSEEEVARHLDGDLHLGAVNTPSLCVISGATADVEALEKRLSGANVGCRRIPASHAYHSPFLASAARRLREELSGIELRAPTIPYVSNLTGSWVSAAQATDPDYWARHSCETVRFADGIRTLQEKPERVLLEVGPGQGLCSFAMQAPRLQSPDAPPRAVFPTTRSVHDRQPDRAFLLNTEARLWLSGARIDLQQISKQERSRRVPLPTYPFERHRYWVDPEQAAPAAQSLRRAPEKRSERSSWFYAPSWKQLPMGGGRPGRVEGSRSWLILADELGIGDALAKRIRELGMTAIVGRTGTRFERLGEEEYTLDPGAPDDFASLLAALHDGGEQVDGVAHLLGLRDPDRDAPRPGADVQQSNFYSVLHLGQALAEQLRREPIRLVVVSNNVHRVVGSDARCPEQATVLGPSGVLPAEVADLEAVAIDIDLRSDLESLASQLETELVSRTPAPLVAYRGDQRWVRGFEPVTLETPPLEALPFRRGGVYLVTGGLGGLGLAVAGHLHEVAAARLVLVGRSGLPPRDEWDRLLDGDDARAHAIRAIRELEARGAELLILRGDVSDEAAMRDVVHAAHSRLGPIRGVVHAAGVPGAGLISLKTDALAEEVLAPKVHGTRILHAVLEQDPLDFVVLFSSAVTVTPALGEVDYCAANSFLDAWAQAHAGSGAPRIVSINWGLWQWDRWQKEKLASLPEAQRLFADIRSSVGLSVEEGIDAFRRALASDLPQVVVSPQDLDALVRSSRLLSVESALGELAGSPRSYERPELATRYQAPRSELERRICEMWQDSLGIDAIGVNDGFLELGGHSLLATQIVARLCQEFETRVSVRDLFESGTVAGLAALVESGRGSGGTTTLSELVAENPAASAEELESLSDAEVEAKLRELMSDTGS